MKLFGGAITAEIPPTLLDASNLREVPDHQEVYVGTFEAFDISLIIELLEPVDKPSIVEALVYHVEETHRVSGTAAEDREEPVETLSMMINDYQYAERVDLVKTKLGYISLVFGLIRLEKYHTDVLVTCSLNPQQHRAGSQEVDAQKQAVRSLVNSFKVEDPSLFREHEPQHPEPKHPESKDI